MNKYLCVAAISLILGAICIDYGESNSDSFRLTVSGTIINKRKFVESTCSHPEHGTTYYEITVKPYDLNTYNIYKVNTTYDTYVNHKVGDNIAFIKSVTEVLKDPPSKWKYFMEVQFPFIIGGICVILSISCVIYYLLFV